MVPMPARPSGMPPPPRVRSPVPAAAGIRTSPVGPDAKPRARSSLFSPCLARIRSGIRAKTFRSAGPCHRVPDPPVRQRRKRSHFGLYARRVRGMLFSWRVLGIRVFSCRWIGSACRAARRASAAGAPIGTRQLHQVCLAVRRLRLLPSRQLGGRFIRQFRSGGRRNE
jgi:hypothetical protein